MNLQIILGPPGTGKTTDLLTKIEKRLAGGADPRRIGYMAFTKKAAVEGRERAQVRFNFKDEELPWFRTIHSTCFRQTGASMKNMISRDHMREIADRAGFQYDGTTTTEEDELALRTIAPADRMFGLENFARSRGLTLQGAWNDWVERHAADNFTFEDLVHLEKTLSVYKASRGLLDHTDVLQNFLSRGFAPKFDVLMVDEAQDLSSLQWDVVRKLAANSDEVMVAGDDDQAIFRWAGADVDQFIDLPGEEVVLSHSYRLPKTVWRFARSLTTTIKKRRVKEFDHNDEVGDVDLITSDTDLEASEGSWLLLARHEYQLRDLRVLCESKGWFYETKNFSSNMTSAARAIIAWENLRNGFEVPTADALLAADHAGVNVEAPKGGAVGPSLFGERLKTPWTSWTLADSREGLYFSQCRRAGERMAKKDERGFLIPVKPRIKVSTVHGAKGGEADGVYMLTDLSDSTFTSYLHDPDDELRVMYVGATRAKKRLIMRMPTTDRAWEVNV